MLSILSSQLESPILSNLSALLLLLSFLYVPSNPVYDEPGRASPSPPESASPIPTVTLSFYHSLSSHLEPDSLFFLSYPSPLS